MKGCAPTLPWYSSHRSPLILVLTILVPHAASAQTVQQRPAGRVVTQAEFEALQSRVAALEAQRADGADVTALERRITELERKQASSQASAHVSTSVPASKAAWRQPRTGMSEDKVRALLGEPEKVDGGFFTYWYYSKRERMGPFVRFSEGTVRGWQEPD